MLRIDELKKDKTEEICSLIDEVYEIGHSDGYNEGYDEGCSEYDSTVEINDAYEEGNDDGRNKCITEILDTLGYDVIRKIQDKTGFQICYGTEIDFYELLLAIKEQNL